ncbi:MAG: type I DNA topoisomerase, partial [Marinosulfonomonas sp.]|nr:type I DNA topoisomerase [Marinosulfonomonas sp.]
MPVVVVESPAKAKTINKYLGDNYTVLASYGHVRDLPPKNGSVDTDNEFAMTWEIGYDSRKHVKAIADALKDDNELILATDPDREGEAISWHLEEALRKRKSIKKDTPVSRVVFNAITKSAVTEAMKNPRQVDMPLVEAYLARRALDYLVGFNLSPVLWRKLPGAKSAGRVQSVCLRLIVEREMEIEAFNAREYWSVKAALTTPRGQSFEVRLTHLAGQKLDKFDLENSTAAELAVQAVNSRDLTVQKVEAKPANRNPSAPFMTSTLQQEASRKFGFGARQTMSTAQRLYEAGYITYMRTDGIDMAPEAVTAARAEIENRYGKEYVPASPRIYKNKAKNAQEAHECIRPTEMNVDAGKLTRLEADQRKLYDLIWKRTLASQMEQARLERTTVDVGSADGQVVMRATGQVVMFDGFMKVYEEGRDDSVIDDDDKRLPQVAQGDSVDKKSVTPEQHFTQPPPRYNEGSLVAALEESGIGRPSTYAPIIETLRRRRYVRMQKRMFVPTRLGMTVTDWLLERFPGIMDVEFTAHVEEELDKVEQAKQNWVALLREFYQGFEAQLQQAKDAPHKSLEGQKCPKCGGQLYERFSVRGKFAGCENYFDESIKCDYTQDLLEDVLPRTEAEEIGEECPECGGQLLKRTTQWGSQFIGCSNYPKCKYTRNIGRDGKPKKPAVVTDMPCEKEDCNGHLVLRHGKRGS